MLDRPSCLKCEELLKGIISLPGDHVVEVKDFDNLISVAGDQEGLVLPLIDPAVEYLVYIGPISPASSRGSASRL